MKATYALIFILLGLGPASAETKCEPFDIANFSTVLCSGEEHAGLGGWVGAIGAIVAIFAAWGLARSEYRRTRRESIKEKLRHLEMLWGAILAPSTIVASYTGAVQRDRQEAKLYYDQNRDNYGLRLMRDLYDLPLTSWPNVWMPLAFRPYWDAAKSLLDTADDSSVPDKKVLELAEDCNKKWDQLKKMINVIRFNVKTSDTFNFQ